MAGFPAHVPAGGVRVWRPAAPAGAPQQPQNGALLARFLGKWKDGRGSDVLVERPDGDPASTQLKVWLIKAKEGRSIPLQILQRKDGKFICGHFELNAELSRTNELIWINMRERDRPPNVWRRAAEAAVPHGSFPLGACGAPLSWNAPGTGSRMPAAAPRQQQPPRQEPSSAAPARSQEAAGVVREGQPKAPGTAGAGGGGGGRGGGHDPPRLELISRKLSQVLRHGEKVPVREDGFCYVTDLMKLRRLQELRCTLADLQQVVGGNAESGNFKERFQLVLDDPDGPMIRAVQGFSRKDVVAERAYRRLTPQDSDLPESCVHGTYKWHWESILERGLLPGGRRGRGQRSEVHFAKEVCAISGMRSDCNLVISLDLQRALQDGLPFYVSENGVILSPGDETGCIPATYFDEVMDYTVDPPERLAVPVASKFQ